MAVAFDAVGPSAAGAGGTTSPQTFSMTATAGATVLVGVAVGASPDTSVTVTVDYGGQAMTAGLRWESGGTGQTLGFLQYFTLANAPGGAQTVTVTVGGTVSGIECGGISVTGGGNIATPIHIDSAGVSSAGGTMTVASSTSGGMIVGFAADGAGFTAWTTGTSRFVKNLNSSSTAGNLAGATIPSTGGSVALTFTQASDFYAGIAVEILPASPPPPPKPMVIPPGRISPGALGFQPLPVLQLSTPSAAKKYITGLAGGGTGYFADQFGNPRMVLGDAVWALPGNAGRWSSGNWQGDFDTYFATRGGQGFTVAYCKPMGTTQSGNLDDFGKTFDALYPFQGGTPSTGVSGANPSTGLTSAFWARIDYMLASAQAQGITVFLNAIGYNKDFESGPGPLAGKSSTEFQAYGAALGARYASTPNLVWMVADDYFGSVDTLISAFLTGLRGAGDSHAISIENMPESGSRNSFDATPTVLAWGTANAQFNFCYSYDVAYFGVERAYAESSPIPVIQGDGYFYQGGSVYSASFDRAVRQDAWHAISSGARGIIHGDEACWQWASTAQASVTNNWYGKNNAGNIRALMESLAGWHLLRPDASSQLVTAGRGTHASAFASGGGGGQYEPAFTDTYVTASRTPDGSLAVIYFSHAATITIDQAKLGAGYTATWADPVTGAQSGTAAGATYNSAAQGSNSAGDPDWVLILAGPAVTGAVTPVPVVAPLAAATQAANW